MHQPSPLFSETVFKKKYSKLKPPMNAGSHHASSLLKFCLANNKKLKELLPGVK
jgi:hypothetical protein